MKTLAIGVISEGTMRPEDVLPRLADALKDVDENGEYAGMVEDAYKTARTCEEFDLNGDGENPYEYAHELMDRFNDVLSDYMPPYCYVGSLEGDGACIGVFPDHDALEMAVHDGDIAKIDGGVLTLDMAYQNGFVEAVEVNDHGNMTLYSHDGESWQEVWAVV